MSHQTIVTGPNCAKTTIILAHGAGGAMDSKWMDAMCEALSQQDLQVVRFEFAYMAARRTTGKRTPPPRAERLQDEYKSIVSQVGKHRRIVIGGKSMGGRVASMIADELRKDGLISGLLCLGYPFHPLGKPDVSRTAHLERLQTLALICQGTRDHFGTREEAAFYPLSKSIELCWLEDGDHDFKPRKAVSELTLDDNLRRAARKIAEWAEGLGANVSDDIAGT